MVEEMLVKAWVRQAFSEGWDAAMQDKGEAEAWRESAARSNLDGECDLGEEP